MQLSNVSSFKHFLTFLSIDRKEEVALISLMTFKLYSFPNSRYNGSKGKFVFHNYCQARVPGLKHLREKLKSQRESQKGTRADAIIQMHHHHHPPTQ